MTKVSVIVPIYNGENFLPSFVNHLKEFTFQDFEVIFVDNNSSDNSLVLLKTILADCAFNYLVLSESKQGAGHARNLGLSVAKGIYVTFIDCDDSISNTKLEEDIKIIEQNEVDFVLCRTQRIYTDGRTIKHPLPNVEEGIVEPPHLGIIWISNFFNLQGPGAILAKTEVINYLGGFHSSKIGEDAFLFIRLGLYARGFYYNKVNNFYVRHSNSTISNRNKEKNGVLLSYFNLRKNLYSDELVMNNVQAIRILNKQINSDLFRLHHSGYDVNELIDDERLKDFKLNFLLFNTVSLLINKMIPHIKYNPFFYVWRRVK